VVSSAVAAVLQSIKSADLEGAKSRIGTLIGQAKTEREKGSLMAAAGILTSISKGREDTLQNWEWEKVARAAQSVRKSQMSDDWDQGYAETLASYAKMLKKRE